MTIMYEFLKEFVETENADTQPERHVISEAAKYFKNKQVERNEHLLEFIKEFVESEEFQEYLNAKKSIQKKEISTQYCEEDYIITPPAELASVIEEFPLTKRSQWIHAFITQIEKYLKRKAVQVVLQKQEQSIQLIKEKIAYFRTLYDCILNKNLLVGKQQPGLYDEKILLEFNIGIDHLNLVSKNALINKIKCHNRMMESRWLNKYQNYKYIFLKLTKELSNESRRKPMCHRAQILKKPITQEEEIFECFEDDLTVSEEEVVVEDFLDVKPENDDSSKNKLKRLKAKHVGTSKGESKKSKKDKKSSKGLSKKKGKKKNKVKKKGKVKKFIMPDIPICNIRRKINSALADGLKSLLGDFETFDNALQEQYLMSATAAKNAYAVDESLICSPRNLVYNDFHIGKRYRKKLMIFNNGHESRKIRILSFKFDNNVETSSFLIDPLPEIMKIARGCTVQMSVVFIPDSECLLKGELIFLTYSKQEMAYLKFSVPIYCIPTYVNVEFSCLHIDFNKVPFWDVTDSNFKLLKLQNNGSKPCKLVIEKSPKYSLMTLQSEEDKEGDVQNAVVAATECIFDKMFGPFLLESHFIHLLGFKNVNIKIYLRDVDHIGSYCDKYQIDVYEATNECSLISSQQLFIMAEITGHFLKVIPEVLDFGVCIFNSIYQLGLDIENSSSSIQAVNIKIPSSVSGYIKFEISNLSISAKTTKTVCVKIFPRHNIKNTNYFDNETSVLEVPIHVYIVTKNSSKIPPIRATILAILTERFLEILPIDKDCYNETVLDLGNCTIFETVFTYFKIKNNTMAKQICGFTNLPDCITISPNFGFVQLFPGEEKHMKLYFHPSFKDTVLFDEPERVINYLLYLESLTKRGETKKDLTNKQLRRSVDLMLAELKRPDNIALNADIEECMMVIKSVLFNKEFASEEASGEISTMYGEKFHFNYDVNTFGESCGEVSGKIPTKSIMEVAQCKVKAKIVRMLVQPSFNHIILSDTPCGSYSSKEIELKSVGYSHSPCDLFKNLHKNVSQECDTFFRIIGETSDIQIQPNCGVLKMGETRKITIFSVPSIPKKIVEDTARAIKYEELVQLKIEQAMKTAKNTKGKKGKHKAKKGKKGKEKVSKKGKDKGSKKGKDKGSKKGTDKGSKKGKKKNEKENRVEDNQDAKKSTTALKVNISETELELNQLDFFPAEMVCWRNLEAYTINTKFWCIVRNIDGYGIYKEPNYFCLDTFCTVVKPDFITNLNSQRIKFGVVPIGVNAVKTIILRNINYGTIKPKLGVLDPEGPFRIPFIRDLNVPAEHCLTIPIQFEPTENKASVEYFEITSGETTLPLILDGTGVPLDLNIQPNFLVIRLQTSPRKLAECAFSITNNTPFDLSVVFQKICELEGSFKKIQSKEKETTDEDKVKKSKDKTKKGKMKDKKGNKKSTKWGGNKGLSVHKYTNELSDFEQVSLNETFDNNEENSMFHFLNNVNTLEKECTSVFRVYFGDPQLWLIKKEKIEKTEKRKGKKGKGKKTPRRSAKSVKNSKLKISENTQYFVSKFNIFVSGIFVRDVILICSFKAK